MHARQMYSWWKNCRFARMSSGHYCLIRDLGLVKGGKGLRHHEVLIAFSVLAALRRIRQFDPIGRFRPAPADSDSRRRIDTPAETADSLG